MPTKVVIPPPLKTAIPAGWNVSLAVKRLRTCPYHKQNNLCQPDKTVADAITAGNPGRKFSQVDVPGKSGPALEAYGFKPTAYEAKKPRWQVLPVCQQ